MANRRRAFTLVELLVVISIIGLLVSLLLPALSGAKMSAWTSMGLANLRGCFQAIANYGADNNDGFVKPYSSTATFKGNFFVAPNGQRWTTAVQTPPGEATVATVGGQQLPMVGIAEIWADPLWKGGYIVSPGLFHDPGKVARIDAGGGASTLGTLMMPSKNIVNAYRTHDPNTGATVPAYATTGMGCAYMPSMIFRNGSIGLYSGQLAPHVNGYYDYHPRGRYMKLSTRPYPSQNMALKDSSLPNFPWGFAIYYFGNTSPFRNGSYVTAAGTTASVFFDGHAGIQNNVDITCYNSSAGQTLYPYRQNPANATTGSTWPDPNVYPSFIGDRYWDCRNANPLGPAATDVNGSGGMDRQNMIAGQLTP